MLARVWNPSQSLLTPANVNKKKINEHTHPIEYKFDNTMKKNVLSMAKSLRAPLRGYLLPNWSFLLRSHT
jgi:hypothetical protein